MGDMVSEDRQRNTYRYVRHRHVLDQSNLLTLMALTYSSAPGTDPDKKHQSKPDVNVKQKSTATETPKSKNPMTVLRKLRPRSNKDIEKGNLPTEKTATSLTDKNATASSELEAKP